MSGRRAFDDRQALMVRELHHRVKNILATVQAVVNATVRSSLTIPELTRALSGRITSLARTHALITEDVVQAAVFEGLLRAELGPYDERRRLTLDGPTIVLPPELAVPIGAEHDGPPVTHPTRQGFGHGLLKKVLSAQTGAEVAVDFERDGIRVSVRMPLPEPLAENHRPSGR